MNYENYDMQTDDESYLKCVQDDVNDWFEYWEDNIKNGNDDLKFSRGDQWSGDDMNSYEQKKKARLTMNVLNAYILNIVGDQRQNTSEFMLRSLNGKASQQNIKLMEGTLREISYASDADTVYSNAFNSELRRGFGAWLIDIVPMDKDSFEEKIILKDFKDPSIVYFDPNAKESTKSDGDWCGYFEIISTRKFKKIYPKVDNIVSFDLPQGINDYFLQEYPSSDKIIINHHYKKEFEHVTTYKLNNGEEITGTKDDVNKRLSELRKMKNMLEEKMIALNAKEQVEGSPITSWKKAESIRIVDEKDSLVCKIRYTKAIKNNILDDKYIKGEYLPIIYVDGDSDYYDGKQITRSFIRDARDAQKLLNYSISDIAQYLKEAKRAKFFVTKALIAGNEKEWKNPEMPTLGLPINPDPSLPGGIPAALPSPEVPQSLMSMPNLTTGIVQNILGRYEANQGAQGNETSRVAIAKREQTGNTTIFIYRDNLNKAIEWSNKICLSLIPEVYFENRYLTLRERDGKTKTTALNAKIVEELKRNKFSVEVSIGPSFAMQKADNYAQLIQLASLDPQRLPQLLGDLIAENVDVQNTQQIVDRMKNFYVPPTIIAKEAGQQPPPPPPPDEMAKAQMQAQKLSVVADLISSIADIKKSNADLEQAKNDSSTTNVKAHAEISKAQLEYLSSLMDAASNYKISKLQQENAKLRQELTGRNAEISEYKY